MTRAVRPWLLLAAADGFLAVAAGAFGAHAAADPLTRELLRTGAQYQGVHAVAAFAIAAATGRTPTRLAKWAVAAMALGALVFGGSLDLLAATGGLAWGAVTPIGGLMLLAGWALTGVAVWRDRS